MLTLIISSTYSPIQVTVLSSNGTDLTSSIPILHSHLPLSTLQQRSSTVTLVNECPNTANHASQSWCERTISPRAFATYCQGTPEAGQTDAEQEPRTDFKQGKCALDELCVGSTLEDKEIPVQASCVSMKHYVPIGPDPEDGNAAGSSSAVTAGFNPAVYNKEGSRVAVEAVLTSAGTIYSLYATSLVMQAQSYNGLWRAVADGYSYCTDCSSVRLVPFPETAQRVKVDVVLPESLPTGLLWLASYPHPG